MYCSLIPLPYYPIYVGEENENVSVVVVMNTLLYNTVQGKRMFNPSHSGLAESFNNDFAGTAW